METFDSMFVGERLRLARQRLGLTRAELGERVGVSHAFVYQLESGVRQPTPVMWAACAAVLGFEPKFFSRPMADPFLDEECHFRKRKTTPQSARDRFLAWGTLFGELAAFLDATVKLPPNKIRNLKVSNREDIERAAEKCRRDWGLGADVPIVSMVRVLEHCGALVARVDAGLDPVTVKVDAFSRVGTRNVVFLNLKVGSASRHRYDLAHECGHLVMHSGAEPGAPETEEQADQFASAFLLPRAAFLREFPRGPRINWPSLYALKRRWKTSLQALIRRAYDLKLIDAAQYQRAFKFMYSRGWAKGGEPAEPEAEKPEVVSLALRHLWRKLSPQDVADKLGWKTETLKAIAGLEEIPETRGEGGGKGHLRAVTSPSK